MTHDIKYRIKSIQKTDKISPLMKLCVSESSPMYVIHKTVTKQLNKKRQGSANCKTRSEVKGGGAKPWKQKGTGRARAGSSRSPLWKGGGVIFGPKTKSYGQKVNKKERQLAISNMLFNKKNFTFTIETASLIFDKPKTKTLLNNIEKLNINITETILIIMAVKRENTCLAARNLKNIEIISTQQLNLLSLIKAKYILIEASAVKIITKPYNE